MATTRGGLLEVVGALASLQARDHEVLVLAPVEPRRAAGAGGPRWIAAGVRGNADVAGHRRVLAEVRAFAPDAAFLHAGSPGELAVAAALVARRAPAIVVEHAPDHYPLAARVRDAVFARCKGRADAWVAVSEASARSLEARWRLRPGRLRVVRNGAAEPPERAPAPEVAALFAGAAVVLGAGAPERSKGFDVFSATARGVARSLPGVRWLWVGGGEARFEPPVTVLPWSDALGWMLRRAALLVIPSRAEGLPLVLLEGWACGAAVAASAVGGIPEVAADGHDAVLLPPGDEDAWVASVGRLLGDPAARARLGAAGRAKWRVAFTADAMAARYAAHVEEVVGRRGRARRAGEGAP